MQAHGKLINMSLCSSWCQSSGHLQLSLQQLKLYPSLYQWLYVLVSTREPPGYISSTFQIAHGPSHGWRTASDFPPLCSSPVPHHRTLYDIRVRLFWHQLDATHESRRETALGHLPRRRLVPLTAIVILSRCLHAGIPYFSSFQSGSCWPR